jgi:DMSO/TMAO reductase YedYZ molybdopterin-dependent catalytic subunit
MYPKDMRPTRRAILGAFVSAGGWLLVGCSSDDETSGRAPAQPGSGAALCAGGFAGGTFLRVVPFEGEGPTALDVPSGAGLDGRLYDDLSTLVPDQRTTPTSRFYIRTRYPDRLVAPQPWRVGIDGLVAEPVVITLDDLAPLVGPRGVHLLECSGNGGGAFFGMVSTAEWDGVPLAALLDAKTRRLPAATRVLVSGFDDHSQPSARSTAGASWIFTFGELAETGAFLATRMNGEPLPPDHGAPLRLVVPGWYGCTCIKWVDAITLVDDSAAATSQMQEFASRTMQNGMPALARDYLPAEIDQTAMPVRVEEWSVGGRNVYRILGMAWGGKRPTDALSIRMNADLPFERVAMCAPVTTNATWSWWSYAFEPSRPGAHAMRLRVDDPSIRTRRLDSGFYERVVTL